MYSEIKIYLKIYTIILLLAAAITLFIKSGDKSFGKCLIGSLETSLTIPALVYLFNV